MARRASSTACRHTCTVRAMLRADDVVGAVELRRHPPVVIRQAEAQRAHAVPRQQPAQADVSAGIGVPLRQHQHGRARRLDAASPARKVAAVHGVVLGMRRHEGAGKRQHLLAVSRRPDSDSRSSAAA